MISFPLLNVKFFSPFALTRDKYSKILSYVVTPKRLKTENPNFLRILGLLTDFTSGIGKT